MNSAITLTQPYAIIKRAQDFLQKKETEKVIKRTYNQINLRKHTLT